MNGKEVYDILNDIGATHLHHANSVATSCTFLENGALLSRDYVEKNGLIQSVQGSDAEDKAYGIWNRIFLDHVDIHDRGGRKKGPNQYGPVLFVFSLDILLNLPQGTEIEITKCNPIHWWKIPSNTDRWFQSVVELAKTITYGSFDNMLVIMTTNGKLEFPNKHVDIILDDPQRQLSNTVDAYTHAESRIIAAAAKGQVSINLTKRTCRAGCICLDAYAKYPNAMMDKYFLSV